MALLHHTRLEWLAVHARPCDPVEIAHHLAAPVGPVGRQLGILRVALELAFGPLAERPVVQAPRQDQRTPKQGRDRDPVVGRVLLHLP